jgi:hypothetical protein
MALMLNRLILNGDEVPQLLVDYARSSGSVPPCSAMWHSPLSARADKP